MSRKNTSKLFFKDYFKEENGFNFNHVLVNNGEPDERTKNEILRRNKEIKGVELKQIPTLSIVNETLSFIIAYPGLITGIGLVHDSKKMDGAYNLGMHFDYTWGMPIVYGSSVKGVLRQYFKEYYKGNLDVVDLIEDIFEGKVRNEEKDEYDSEGKLKKRGYNNKSIYERDIFFDAVIKETYQGHLLEDDSITPHGDNPLKNPNPITMLKIAPGCRIEFRFHLDDSGVFKKQDKYDLFKEILEAVGVGAKTNVGYGQLEYK